MNKIYYAEIAAIIGVLLFTGCGKDTTAADVGEKAGAALDTAAEKTAEWKPPGAGREGYGNPHRTM